MPAEKSLIRVCQLWDEYLPVFTGAAVRHNQLMPHLQVLGVSVEVLTVQGQGMPLRDVIGEVPVFRVPAGKQSSRNLRHVVNGLRLCRAIWSRRSSFDVLYSLSANEFYLPASLLARLLGKPVILEFNLAQSTEISLPAKLLSAWAYFCYRWFDAYVPLSTPLRNALVERGLQATKCHLIPVGVYTDEFIPLEAERRTHLRAELGLSPHVTYLLFTGSFIHRKGVDILVEMMSCLSESHPQVQVLIVGQHEFPADHPARSFAEQMKQKIRQRGLQDRIHLLGRLDPQDVLPWLQASDIFVFPSRREGLPRVILEAMSVGLPCVVAAMDGSVYDMIEPEVSGLVVEDLNAPAFAAQVLRLVDDPALRRALGERARQVVVSRFDDREAAKVYRQLFEKVL